jgi:uroporphyrinogen decarboxylase
VFDLIEDLIESGVDILNPVQTSARGMDPVRLKRVFGRDVVFWGAGVDTQHVLPHGTVHDVRDNVRRALDVFAPGGGYVFATIHNIQADVPPANIAALFEAFEDYRGY